MSRTFFLFAQSLDNDTADFVSYNGKMLNASEKVKRAAVVSQISDIVGNSTKSFALNGGRIFCILPKRAFVLEILPNEKDVLGRGAPICYYGIMESMSSNSCAKQIEKAIVDFASRIGRTINDEHLQNIPELLSKIEEQDRDYDALQKRKQEVINIALLLGIGIVCSILAWKIIYK